MKYMKLAAGLLTLAVSVGIGTNAFADVVQKTITMNQSANAVSFQDVEVGDTLQMTLINPTNDTLVFQTNQRLGNDLSWTVPPNSSRTIVYTYTQPFDQNVQFMVVNPSGGSGGNIIAQGLMLPGQVVSTTWSTISSPFRSDTDVTTVSTSTMATQTEADRGYFGNMFYNLGNGTANVVKAPFAFVADVGEGVVDTAALAGRGLSQIAGAPFGNPLEKGPDKLKVVQADSNSLVTVTETGIGNDVQVSMVQQPQPPAVAVVTQGTSAVTQDVSAPSIFRHTMTLAPNTPGGELEFSGLDTGDEVILTLINPTNQPLRFETTERLGGEASWIIPANSQRVISFTYDQPFQNDVEYIVSSMGSQQQGTSAVRGYW